MHLLYKNLIQPLHSTPFAAIKVPGADDERAFLSAVNQIRRFIYGNLTEVKLSRYINGKYKTIKFMGVMSYYPLVTDKEQLKRLDRWLISTIIKHLSLRNKLLTTVYGDQSKAFPYLLDSGNIVKVCKKLRSSTTGVKGQYTIPSFLRIYNAIQLGISRQGLNSIIIRDAEFYNYNS